MSFFRYPGGKAKLRGQIVSLLTTIAGGRDLEYREPFFGGGGIGSTLFQSSHIKKFWINDKDLGIACLWTAVMQHPDLLKSLVQRFEPSIEKFDQFKAKLLSGIMTEDIVQYGFMKLAIHQMSYSGLGTKSGGPLGGRKEGNVAKYGMSNGIKYPIDCRWSPDYICKKIDHFHLMLARLSIRRNECSSLDFSNLITDTTDEAILYLDPPYYIKGNDLYQHGFTQQDHQRLAALLKKTKHRWVLSYDDCLEIQDLYNWANVRKIDGINYSITALRNKETSERLARTKTELLITNCKF